MRIETTSTRVLHYSLLSKILLGDISTAFLHASLDYEFYVWPPKEYYPGQKVLWRLKKALYGLKEAPKAWQDHFAEVLLNLGGCRMKADANLYYFEDDVCWVLVYVDDLLIVGQTFNELFESIAGKFHSKEKEN